MKESSKYGQSLLVGFLLLWCSSCYKGVDPSPMLDLYDRNVIDYFQQIVMGFESGSATEVTRRWEQHMKIFVGGNPTLAHREELVKIIGEINELTTTNFVVEEVPDRVLSNYYIYFGSGRDYARFFPDQSNLVKSNFGLFRI